MTETEIVGAIASAGGTGAVAVIAWVLASISAKIRTAGERIAAHGAASLAQLQRIEDAIHVLGDRMAIPAAIHDRPTPRPVSFPPPPRSG